MHNRLSEIIQYKTGGKQTDFANMMGWTPQYLAKLLKGENFGIRPIMAIVETLSEINARWLLTGEGNMLEGKIYNIKKNMFSNILNILEIEKYMPVMSSSELYEFEEIIMGRKEPCFSPILIEKWKELTNSRENNIDSKFTDAFNKSNK